MNKKMHTKNRHQHTPLIEFLEPRLMMSADLPGLDILVHTDEQQDLDAESQSLIESAEKHFAEMDSDTLPSSEETMDDTQHEEIDSESLPSSEEIIDDTQHEEINTEVLLSSKETEEVDSEALPSSEEIIDETNHEEIDSEVLPSSEETIDDTRHELIIVDSAVTDYELLVDDISAQSDNSTHVSSVLILDPNEDGLLQITDALSDQTDLDAIHIISHGSAGEIHIGESTLDLESTQANAEIISTWSNALDESADILIYGCDLASTSEGEALVETLADLTGADVAASDDTTGHKDLGGDWDLEYEAGDIETNVVLSDDIQDAWSETLIETDTTTVVDDTVSTNEDTAVNINVIKNDTAANGKSKVDTVTQGAHGTVERNGNGTLTYTPGENFNGTDRFTYTNDEGTTGTVTITVNAVDDPDLTIVVDDTATINEGTPVDIDVLANDTDVDAEKSPVTSVTDGSNGSVTINDHGTLTYTPDANFNGTDSFTYTNAEGTTGTVSLTVTSVNDAPAAVVDSYTVAEDGSVIIDVTANNTGSGGTIDPTTVVITTQPTNGTVVVDATTGEVTYTPNANFNGTDSFTYTDVNGNTGTVTITVTPTSPDDPIDKIIDDPSDDPVDTPIDNPIDTPSDASSDDPVDTPINTPSDDPIDDPIDDSNIAPPVLASIDNLSVDKLTTLAFTATDSDIPTQSDSREDVSTDISINEPVDNTDILINKPVNDIQNKIVLEETIQEEVARKEEYYADDTEILTEYKADETDQKDGSTIVDSLEAIKMDSLNDVLNTDDASKTLFGNLKKTNSTMAQQLLSLEPLQMNSLLIDTISNPVQSEIFHADLEKMYQDIDESFEEEKRKNEFADEAAAGITLSLTAGFVVWLLRPGTLIASLFATMPMWRNFDPVSILSESESKEQTSDEIQFKNTEEQSQQAEQIFDIER